MAIADAVTSLRGVLEAASARAKSLSPAQAWNALTVLMLRRILRELAAARGIAPELLANGRLFCAVPGFEADTEEAARAQLLERLEREELIGAARVWDEPLVALPAEAFGQLYESLLAARPSARGSLRKSTGSYYTPEGLTRVVVERAFAALPSEDVTSRALRIVDPALGAGAFLLQAGRVVAERSGRALSSVVRRELFGVDVSPLAVAVAEVSLWLLAADPSLSLGEAGAQLRQGDALCSPGPARALSRQGIDWNEPNGADFDLVIGNPPWVAFAGRATQPLPPALRRYYRAQYRSFRGYPTLHALFIELSTRIAPRGVVALLIPSPVADLAGYRHVRSHLRLTHAPEEPLLELGQDAFQSVTQPCFALIAKPSREVPAEPERAFVLSERSRAAAEAKDLAVPPALLRLLGAPKLPAELFGEMGFQTSARVTKELLYRGTTPPKEYNYALLEGRDVREFRVRSPRLFLRPDRDVLRESRCRLREAAAYAGVKLVIRQTAAIPIAALHDGTPFRNSLLAGFESAEFPAALLLGLLNSQLYRALHLAARRDARQTTFPQVKISHLRALPAPARRSTALTTIERVAAEASRGGLDDELRRALDAAVFEEFELDAAEAAEVTAFVRDRAPRAGLTAE
jgi:hypothetical protein